MGNRNIKHITNIIKRMQETKVSQIIKVILNLLFCTLNYYSNVPQRCDEVHNVDRTA
jgi:hypothetical protein